MGGALDKLLALAESQVKGFVREERGHLEHVTPYLRRDGKGPAFKPRGTVAFDFDGTLNEYKGQHWPLRGDLDLTGIDKAHQRGYAAAVITANDYPERVAAVLQRHGYDATTVNPGRPWEWLGGPTGRRVLVTNRKIGASAYVDDKAIHHSFGDDWDQTLDQVESVRSHPHPRVSLAAARPEVLVWLASALPPSATAPGAKPVYDYRLRHQPSQTQQASPPLPPGVKIPTPAEVTKFAGEVSKANAGGDNDHLTAAVRHLDAAATALTNQDPIEALHRLRSVQMDITAAEAEHNAAQLPVANVFSATLAPAERSSALAAMAENLQTRTTYRKLGAGVGQLIDRIRRAYFHGQYPPGYPSGWGAGGAKLTQVEISQPPEALELGMEETALSRLLRLAGLGSGRKEIEVKGYERLEHGKLEHVEPHEQNFPMPEASYLDKAKAKAAKSGDVHFISAPFGNPSSSKLEVDHYVPVGKQREKEWWSVSPKGEVRYHPPGEPYPPAKSYPAYHAPSADDLGKKLGMKLAPVKGNKNFFGGTYTKAGDEPVGPLVHYQGVSLLGEPARAALDQHLGQGEYGEHNGFFWDSNGEKHWGYYGGAGLLVRAKGEDGKTRYMLQKRAWGVQNGGTWSTPGGAIDRKKSGQVETPEEAAVREGEEEFGAGLPPGTHHITTHTKTWGTGKGAWSYHTVELEAPQQFDPNGAGNIKGIHNASWESAGYGWFTPEEMADLPLHPGFQPTAEELGMPKGGGKHSPHPPPVQYTKRADQPDDYAAGDRVTWRYQGKTLHGAVAGPTYDEHHVQGNLPAAYDVTSDADGQKYSVKWGQLRLETAPTPKFKDLPVREHAPLSEAAAKELQRKIVQVQQGAAGKPRTGFKKGDRISYYGKPGTVAALGSGNIAVKMDDGRVNTIALGSPGLRRKVGEIKKTPAAAEREVMDAEQREYRRGFPSLYDMSDREED